MTYAKDKVLLKKTAEEIVPELVERVKQLENRLDNLTNKLKLKDMVARQGGDPLSVILD